MGQLKTVCLTLIGVFLARFGYQHYEKTKKIRIDESPLFAQRLEGTVKEYEARKRIEEVVPGVYAAIDYSLASSLLIVDDDRWFFLDSTENCVVMETIIADFENLLGKPKEIAGVALTHFHPDHCFGTGSILAYAESLGQSKIPEIWAHDKFKSENEKFIHLSYLGFRRATSQFGHKLERERQINAGIGHRLTHREDQVCYFPPSKTFEKEVSIPFGRFTIQLFHAPGETDDQISIFIPEVSVLIPADNVYPHFPNLYPIRGAPVRSVRQWANTVAGFRKFKAEHMIGMHSPVVHGAEKIDDILVTYHDGMKFVHDQTVRLMENLFTIEDIVEMVKLPKALAEHPWLEQTYGKVEWCVRGVYSAYIGWFDGLPRSLRPLHPKVSSPKLLKLAGKEAIVKDLLQSFKTGQSCGDSACAHENLQWALELVDILIYSEIDEEKIVETNIDFHPRKYTKEEFLKSKIFILQSIAQVQSNPTARNWYLNEANILASSQVPTISPEARRNHMTNLSVDLILRSFETRMNAPRALVEYEGKCFYFNIDEIEYNLLIRNGVLIKIEEKCEKTHNGLIGSAEKFKDLLTHPATAVANLAKGDLKILGSITDFVKFLTLFKPISQS